jgi:hypothetical protein
MDEGRRRKKGDEKSRYKRNNSPLNFSLFFY